MKGNSSTPHLSLYYTLTRSDLSRFITLPTHTHTQLSKFCHADSHLTNTCININMIAHKCEPVRTPSHTLSQAQTHTETDM